MNKNFLIDRHNMWDQLHKKYTNEQNPWMCLLTPIYPGLCQLSTARKALVHEVLTHPDFHHRTGAPSQIINDTILMMGATTRWHRNRRAMQPLFSEKSLRGYAKQMDAVMEEMVKQVDVQ